MGLTDAGNGLFRPFGITVGENGGFTAKGSPLKVDLKRGKLIQR